MFRPIRIVQISSLDNACIGQPLLTFWSHTEQSWICPDSCSFKHDLYCFASLLPMVNLKGIVAKLCVMYMFILFIIFFFCMICLHIHVNGSV